MNDRLLQKIAELKKNAQSTKDVQASGDENHGTGKLTPGGATRPGATVSQQVSPETDPLAAMGIGAAGLGAGGAVLGAHVAPKLGIDRTISTLAGLFGGGAAGAAMAYYLVQRMNRQAAAAPTAEPAAGYGRGQPTEGGAKPKAAPAGEPPVDLTDESGGASKRPQQ